MKGFFKDPAAEATDAPQPCGLLCNPVMKMISFFVFPSNGAPVEWNWQGKTEVLGEKPIPVPRCPPQIPHGLTRDRTRASARRILNRTRHNRQTLQFYLNNAFKPRGLNGIYNIAILRTSVAAVRSHDFVLIVYTWNQEYFVTSFEISTFSDYMPIIIAAETDCFIFLHSLKMAC
jgi:hypothetical protein